MYVVIFCLSYYHVLPVNKDKEKKLHIAVQRFDLQLNFHFTKVKVPISLPLSRAVDLGLMLYS